MRRTRPQLAPRALAHTERVLRAPGGLGLDPGAAMYANVVLFNYVRGLATGLEAELEFGPMRLPDGLSSAVITGAAAPCRPRA
jgi:hypothetical protein